MHGQQQQRKRQKRKIAQSDEKNSKFARNPKQKLVPPIQELSTLIKKTTNEKEMLTKRLELALQMLHVLALLSPLDVLRTIKDELYLVVKLADALLHTAYVPLQQLYFMALTKLLGELNSRSNEVAAAAQRRFMESLKLLNSVLPTVLQPEEVIKLTQAQLARERVNVLNKHSRICRTYIVLQCWISSGRKNELMPIVVDKWVDFGASMITFYHQLPKETILYNVPYRCMEDFEFDDANSLVYVFAKNVPGLDGIRLVVFAVEGADFATFKDVLWSNSPATFNTRTPLKPVTKYMTHYKKAQSKGKPTYPSADAQNLSSPKKQTKSALAMPKPGAPSVASLFKTSEPRVSSCTTNERVQVEMHLRTDMNTGLPFARARSMVMEQPPHGVAVSQPTPTDQAPKTTSGSRQVFGAVTQSADEQETGVELWEPLVPDAGGENSAICASPATEDSATTNALSIFTSSLWHRALRKRTCQVRDISTEKTQEIVYAVTSDLKKTKADCIKDLKQRLGYSDEDMAGQPQVSLVIVTVAVVLIIIPWTLLIALLCGHDTIFPPELLNYLKTR